MQAMKAKFTMQILWYRYTRMKAILPKFIMQILWYRFIRMKAILPKFTMQILWLNVIYLTSSSILIQAASHGPDPRYKGCFVDFKSVYMGTIYEKESAIKLCRERNMAWAAFHRDHLRCVDFSVTYFKSTWPWGGCYLDCPASFPTYDTCGFHKVDTHGWSVYRVCPPHTYGPSCEMDCHCTDDKTSKSADCNPKTGTCRWDHHKRCQSGWWDRPKCQTSCKCLPLGTRCDIRDGTCDSKATSCAPGYAPFPRCSSNCPNGTYGDSCNSTCPPHCKNGGCDPISGTCDECPSGYKGERCDPCPTGTYGRGCYSWCGHCKNGGCHHINGTCDECLTGYTGPKCDKPCPTGTYGYNCTSKCPPCRNGGCHHINGTCDECNPGYTGPKCDKPCPTGTYGDRCHYKCPHCKNSGCHHINGTCDECNPGYTGIMCQPCPTGTYGYNCTSKCPPCANNSCDPTYGTCDKCHPGYTGPECDKHCEAGTWGLDCRFKCSPHCANNDSCSIEDGRCVHGECEKGWRGSKCELRIVYTPKPSAPNPYAPNPSAPNPYAPITYAPNPSVPNPSTAASLSGGFGLVFLCLLIAYAK